MIRESVSSTSIASVGYDEVSGTLEVEFTNGSIYQYFDVDGALYWGFMESDSMGQFMNAYIREDHRFSRVL